MLLSPCQGRGKTTLLSVLRTPSAPLPENVSTVGVNVAEWVVHPPPQVAKKKGAGPPQRVRTLVDFFTYLAGQCHVQFTDYTAVFLLHGLH